MFERIYLNNNWKYTEVFTDEFLSDKVTSAWNISGIPDAMALSGDSVTGVKFKNVRIPHTVAETPLHYFDEHIYQKISGYVKELFINGDWKDKTLLLTFEGVAHLCEVYVNGVKAGEHKCGYTAFTVDISELVKYGEKNIIVVKVDSNENVNVPPFGYVIDYMTYGGIYRDVYLDVKEKTYIKDIFVTTKQAERDDDDQVMICNKSQVIADIKIVNNHENLKFHMYFAKKDEEFSADIEHEIEQGKEEIVIKANTGRIELWDVENPVLYKLKVEILTDDEVLDVKEVTYGYRKAFFGKEAFYLNGRKVKIRGMNRHQSFPYVGYAMPESMQKNDADILKNELGLNAVRTSHYPQSQYFLDRCDELGLMVFTEFPGWQHIGDDQWKEQAVKNVEEMIVQYRNHPSIILWGVRINESVDDDKFYEETNKVAHKLDNTRQTGGVRCYKKSNLLEDVYTYNDFIHSGKNPGCDKKSNVTSDMEKGYLISEYMGHMYPTKAFDWEEHRVEHAIRHANVLNDIAKNDDIAGGFGWCMFDYNTHKDFGSGDRICYHGVMDMFRNPKLAAYVYASQQTENPVLEISSSMDIGEHPGCNRGEMFIFTNADSVRMYKNDYFIKEFNHEKCRHKYMINPPILIDDYIGDMLEKKEHMSKGQANSVKDVLNEVAKFGLYNMSKTTYLKAAKMMVMYKMSVDDAVKLYNKYIGDWGGESTVYKFEAIKDGKVVKTLIKAPMTEMKLKITVDHTDLTEKNTYDVAAVRIEATDEYGNRLAFCNDAFFLKTEGEIELIGPDVLALSGGMGGTYVKTTGNAGKGTLIIKMAGNTAKTIEEKIEFNTDVK